MYSKKQLLGILLVMLLLAGMRSPLLSQTDWVKDPANPVLRRDTNVAALPQDIYAISDCFVLKEGAVYKMWYTGGGFNYPPDTLMRSRICYATSSDGINWNKYAGNPVMDVDYDGGWDSLGVETVSILIDSSAPAEQRYKMWYAGQYFNTYRYDIGYAFSADGIHWTKHGSPVLQAGDVSEWDSGFIEGPSVIKEDDGYKMWYCGYDAIPDGSGTDGKANIGYATSDDGITWTKYAGNPVLTTGGGRESVYVQDPHVIKEDGVYHMWYGGGASGAYYDQQTGYAVSADGINWDKSPLNPVLSHGNAGDWDAIVASFPSVMNDNGIYKMWYTGKDADPLPEGSWDYYWEIGYATAPVTGINNANETASPLNVFPNPAHAVLNFNFPRTEPFDVIIYNAMGQVVITASDQTAINISALTHGIYLITVMQDGNKYDELFIKE